MEWASTNDLHLSFDAKQPGTFRSARWNREYNPDLCWVTSVDGHPQPVSYTVLKDFPHSQHRPCIIHVGLQLTVIRSVQKPRWNFRKARWDDYSDTLERSMVTIPIQCIPVDEVYSRFCQAVLKAAKASIPRGFRPIYIPCLPSESADLLKKYEESGDTDIAEHATESLDSARRARWEESTSKLDLSGSSRKCWSLIRRLGAAARPPVQSHPPVTANQVASHLLKVGKAPLDKSVKRTVRDEWRQYLRRPSSSAKPDAVTTSEIDKVLGDLKAGTAPGYDCIHPEFLTHMGPQVLQPSTRRAPYTTCLAPSQSHRVAKAWKGHHSGG